MSQTRRLAAILAADVAGYSRLMGADEEGTHERLTAHLRELVDPKIAEHRGRTVKNTGDGFLAEFPSVVDAVRCAVELQRGMVERNAEVPPKNRIEFRVGINLGDVIAEEHDIFGDGVNVAARLEALAEPSGVCVSRVVRDQIRDKLPYSFEDQGEHTVKNIARPIRVFALRPETIAEVQLTDRPIEVPRRRRGIFPPVMAAVAAVLVIAVIAWWAWFAPKPTSTPAPAAVAAAATSVPQPLVARHLSIVVLPFANLSKDPDQQYFADGITEDLTTDLSRIPGSFVISTDTALTYRNKSVDAKQIGRELGVRYLLEGSVQRSGNQVRVNAQLIDAETDAHLWAERLDREVTDLFELQSEITGRIASTLNLELIAAEANRPITHPDALDYVFRGREFFFGRPPTPENLQNAISLYEQALRLDPQSTEAKTYLAGALVNRVNYGFAPSRAVDLARAEKLIDEALAEGTKIAWAHYVKGTVLRNKGRYDDALREFEAALALGPNMTGALQGLGWCKLYTGSLDEVIPLAEKAIRIGPRDPGIGFRYLMIGDVYVLQGRPEEAIVSYGKARGTVAAVPGLWARLAAAHALRGDLADAAVDLAEVRRLSPNDRPWSIASVRAGFVGVVPKVQALLEATFFAGLRKAGMPEE
jgi:TolB-like protein/class 3 adenylate cyclase/Flp pilus assembly protein TadD